jgi:DNA-directed RNA polymerase subunit E'/Rpb7
MFLIATVEDKIKIHPEQFGRDSAEVIGLLTYMQQTLTTVLLCPRAGAQRANRN